MAEAHPGAERDQLRRLGRRGRLGRDPKPLGRAPEQSDVAFSSTPRAAKS